MSSIITMHNTKICLWLSHALFLSFVCFGNLSVTFCQEFQLLTLKPHEIAILQFDSRPLGDYWESAARWNSHYCALHGHLFLYFQLNGECLYNGERLASPWCKVRAMIQANEQFPDVKLFLYLDSDAVVDIAYRDTSLITYLAMMQKQLQWNVEAKPLLFNQDGPCWWCNLIERAGYSMCLNAGTVMWYRHYLSEQLLMSWWHSSMHSYSDNPLKRYCAISKSHVNSHRIGNFAVIGPGNKIDKCGCIITPGLIFKLPANPLKVCLLDPQSGAYHISRDGDALCLIIVPIKNQSS